MPKDPYEYTMENTREIVRMLLNGKTQNDIAQFFKHFSAPPVPSGIDRFDLGEYLPHDSLLSLSFGIYNENGISQQYQKVHEELDQTNSATPPLYNVGSICKMMLLALTLRQCDQNKINLDDTISNLIAKYPGMHPLIKQYQDKLNAITLRNLLNHTSGLRDNVDSIRPKISYFPTVAEIAYRRGDPIETQRSDETISKIDFHDPQPGQFYYANVNFIILAYLLEAIYGKLLPDIFEEQIAKPLDLKHSTMREVNPSALARGEIVAREASALEYIYIFGAGCLHTTPQDCAKFFYTFFTDKNFISAASLAIATQTGLREYEVTRKNDPPFRWQCHGGMMEMFWYKDGQFSLDEQVGSRQVFGHGGWTSGHSAFLIYDPQTQQSYCVAVSKRHTYIPKYAPKQEGAMSAKSTPLWDLLSSNLCRLYPAASYTDQQQSEKRKYNN